MKIKRSSSAVHSVLNRRPTFGRLAVSLIAVLAMLLSGPSAQAAFHLWQIREIYTDSSGTYQFVELFCPSSGQTFLNNQSITVTPAGGGAAHTFTLTSNLGSDTLNHALLLST